MRSVLILFAHPALESSLINTRLIERAREVEGVTIHDLYEEYPEFDVDAKREQALLEAHDSIVLQFPLYWYSTPALLKQWFDIVLEHGWAYGSDGNALREKLLLCAVSAGGKEEAYRKGGFHDISLPELLYPIRQTARLCKMKYLPPYANYGTFSKTPEEMGQAADRFAELLIELRDGSLRWEEVASDEAVTLEEARSQRRVD